MMQVNPIDRPVLLLTTDPEKRTFRVSFDFVWKINSWFLMSFFSFNSFKVLLKMFSCFIEHNLVIDSPINSFSEYPTKLTNCSFTLSISAFISARIRESGIVERMLSAARAASKVNKSYLTMANATKILKKNVATIPKFGISTLNDRKIMLVSMKAAIGIAKPIVTNFLRCLWEESLALR